MDSNHFNNGYMPPYPTANHQQQQQQQQPPPPQQPLSSFGNLSSQNHPHDSPSHTTLPPLQSQNGGYQFGNMSYAHPGTQSQSSSTPHTPVSSVSANNAPHYSHMSPSNAPPGSMLPPSTFPTYQQQPMQYPSSTSTPMPSTSASIGLPNLRPMPPGGVNTGMGGLPSLSTGQLGQQPSFLQNEEAPTCRRIARPARHPSQRPWPAQPPAQGSAQSTKSLIPQKDADGKFPCPHCNKTYLHAKHLKRHLLRHTGDRPYMCHLCKDTFSRSDILKRHFQKCSIRRGNPTGANHLAHQRRNTNNTNRLSMSQQDGPIGLAGLQEVTGSNYTDGMTASPTVNGDVSARSSRANSIISPANLSHRGSVAGLGILGSNAAQNEALGTSAGFQPGMPAYATPNTSNGGSVHPGYAFNHSQMQVFNNPSQMPFLGHQSSRFGNSHENSPHQNGDGGGLNEWNRMFNQGGQDGFIGSQPANASSQQMNPIKTDPDTKPNFSMHPDLTSESFLGSLYSHPGAFGSEYGENDQGIFGFPNWSPDDPLQAKVDSLFQYCFPQGVEASQGDPGADLVRECLTVENVKHFAEHYTSFHGHWPVLHMPTFKITDANNGLVLAIICIGAIYSPRINVEQSRQIMDFVHAKILQTSSVYNRTVSGQLTGMGQSNWEVDEMQALIMLQCMLMWHGEPYHRQAARNELPTVVRSARAMGLFHTSPYGHQSYSTLHAGQKSFSGQFDAHAWQWHGWLEQERRNRAMYLLFLADAASVMYFNGIPQIDPFEIRLCLPADDAAWDAKDAESCARALGLFGPQAQSRNVTGTRRPRQPGMREAMRSLLDSTVQLQPNATNAYSKFVLIHALIIRIIACQKAIVLQAESAFQPFSLNSSTPVTPVSQFDWLEQRSGGSGGSANSSGRVTPTDGVQPTPAQQEGKRLSFALERWKRAWDADMDSQYPSSPNTSPAGQPARRFGFSRDGVHFWYLARSFLQSHRPLDWTAPSDARFQQVLTLLKRIRDVVASERGHKGGMAGSVMGSVGDIDEGYGVGSLALDMKLLFKPYDHLVDIPVAGVRTGAF